ncbi:hypothetical protein IT418_03665 [bacterium]|nr:hypothetical protein [bacterium]
MTAAVAVTLCGNFIYPEEQIDGVELPYPFGIGKINDITGNHFNKEAFLKIPTYLYKGILDNKDENDPLFYEVRVFNANKLGTFKSVLGKTAYERFLNYAQYLADHKTSYRLESPPDIGHTFTQGTLLRIFEFFEKETKGV